MESNPVNDLIDNAAKLSEDQFSDFLRDVSIPVYAKEEEPCVSDPHDVSRLAGALLADATQERDDTDNAVDTSFNTKLSKSASHDSYNRPQSVPPEMSKAAGVAARLTSSPQLSGLGSAGSAVDKAIQFQVLNSSTNNNNIPDRVDNNSSNNGVELYISKHEDVQRLEEDIRQGKHTGRSSSTVMLPGAFDPQSYRGARGNSPTASVASAPAGQVRLDMGEPPSQSSPPIPFIDEGAQSVETSPSHVTSLESAPRVTYVKPANREYEMYPIRMSPESDSMALKSRSATNKNILFDANYHTFSPERQVIYDSRQYSPPSELQQKQALKQKKKDRAMDRGVQNSLIASDETIEGYKGHMPVGDLLAYIEGGKPLNNNKRKPSTGLNPVKKLQTHRSSSGKSESRDEFTDFDHINLTHNGLVEPVNDVDGHTLDLTDPRLYAPDDLKTPTASEEEFIPVISKKKVKPPTRNSFSGPHRSSTPPPGYKRSPVDRASMPPRPQNKSGARHRRSSASDLPHMEVVQEMSIESWPTVTETVQSPLTVDIDHTSTGAPGAFSAPGQRQSWASVVQKKPSETLQEHHTPTKANRKTTSLQTSRANSPVPGAPESAATTNQANASTPELNWCPPEMTPGGTRSWASVVQPHRPTAIVKPFGAGDQTDDCDNCVKSGAAVEFPFEMEEESPCGISFVDFVDSSDIGDIGVTQEMAVGGQPLEVTLDELSVPHARMVAKLWKDWVSLTSCGTVRYADLASPDGVLEAQRHLVLE